MQSPLSYGSSIPMRLVQQFTLKKEYRVRGRTLGGKLEGHS